MRSLTLLALSALLSCATGITARAEFATPPVGRLVADSVDIVEGRFVDRGSSIAFEVTRSIRGSVAEGRILSLHHPGRPTAFDLKRLLATASGGSASVLLGRTDGERFELQWLALSVWPQGVGQRWEFLRDRSAATAFVEALLHYEELAVASEAKWLAQIVADLDRADRLPAVLAHLEGSPAPLRGHAELERQLLAVVAAQVASRAPRDEWTVTCMTSLAPGMPASIVVPYLADIAAAGGPTGELARNHAVAALRIRNLMSAETPRDGATLRTALSAALPKLRATDLKKLSPLASAEAPALRGRAGGVLRAITEQSVPADISAEELQRRWTDATAATQ